ncbi:neutral zinc metallopeptidase [Nocardia sp. NPDC052566]|uniref:neutral zinc metallopeptidase n=1 Tax=Nocardia sp. NPDC052566 TaxID=3364330 RepID=UPI0037C5E4EC
MNAQHSVRVRHLRLFALVVLLVSSVLAGCAGPRLTAARTSTISTEQTRAPQQDVARNVLHSGYRLSPLRCQLPQAAMDTEGQRRFVGAALTCVEKLWTSALGADGIAVSPVRLAIVDKPTTSCGKEISATDPAFYCDGTVYWPTEDAYHQGWPPGLLDRYLLFVVMHEYGHHIQLFTGIERTALRANTAGAKSAQAMQTSRRMEMQAQCLAGMTLSAAEQGGVLASWAAKQLIAMQSKIAGTDSHGTGANSKRWTEAGYRGNSTAACNTWAAAPAEVD